VFACPKRSADTFFTVLAAVSGKQTARLGLAISKKQVSRAVDRNRLKRLIREGFRHRCEELAGLDLVIMARRPALDVDNERLRRSLDNHWDKLIRESTRWNRTEKRTR